MRCRHFCIFVSEAWQSALGCSLMRYRLFFNALYEQPRALCHASLTNMQKCLQRIFATLYFVRSFFDDLFLNTAHCIAQIRVHKRRPILLTFVYLVVERDKALSAALWCALGWSLMHSKSSRERFVTLHYQIYKKVSSAVLQRFILCSFFDYLFLQQFTSRSFLTIYFCNCLFCAVFLTIYFDFDNIVLYI